MYVDPCLTTSRKLDRRQVDELRRLYADDGWLLRELAARYDIVHSAVSEIITGKTYIEWTGGRDISRHTPQRRAWAARRAAIRAEVMVKGRPAREVADEFGITYEQIFNILSYLRRKERRMNKPRVRLTPDMVVEIRRRYVEEGLSTTQLAREYDAHPNTVIGIIGGQRWRKVTKGINVSRRPRTAEKHEKFREYIERHMIRGNRRPCDIARDLGITPQRVQQHRRIIEQRKTKENG